MHNIVNDQFVESLHKDSTEMLMQEIQVSQAEHLLTIECVPSGQRVQVETPVHLL